MSGSFSRSFKRFTTAQLARLVRRPRLTPEQLLALRPASIVVVRQHNQMGDMVCATPALRAIRETWPDARIALVTAPVNVEVVRHNPHVDTVLTFEPRSVGKLLAFLKELRSLRPELALVLNSVSFSVTSASIALVSGARWVVGADSRPYGWDVSHHAFSLELPSQPVSDLHAVVHNLAPLEAVGVTTDDLTTVVRSSPQEMDAADGVLADLGLEPGFWAMHPGAGKAQNVWPADRFAAVAHRATGEGHDVLVLHGPADGAALAALKSALAERGAGGRVHIAPPMPVGTAAALLTRADRLLCNDTGIMHVAGAVGVPTLALFGPTDPDLWKPPGPWVAAVRAANPPEDPRGPECGWMENLDVDTVWRMWSRLAYRRDQEEV